MGSAVRPIEIEGRAIDMANFDLTPTAEELEAMKKEPAYGRPIHYYMSDGCTPVLLWRIIWATMRKLV